MYNTTKLNQSPSKNNSTLLSDTVNGFTRNFSSPKLTSTPLHRNGNYCATPQPKPHLLSPKRYSLSHVATPPRYLNRSSSLQNDGGPLMGGSVKLSTYVDAKSPGLTSRAVQYNEERKRLNPTHQKQYGSPGLFPIVHLFKKDLPQLNLQPKRITVRIASPEYSRCSSPEYKRLLLEGIVKEKSAKPCIPQQNNDVSSTRSVLDALKEISRKRIQTNDEFDLLEDSGKRLKTDQYHKETTNKRHREESPIQDNCNYSQNLTKRVCINSDEYAASCSSMNFSFNDTVKQNLKRKSKSSPDQLNENQIKRVTVETQTISIDEDKKTDEKKGESEIVDVTKEKEKEFNSAKRIFNEKPLDTIRKHRLAILLGTLTNKEAFINDEVTSEASNVSASVEEATTPVATPTTTTTSESPLVSILSTPKKSSPKSTTKHVTFNLTEEKGDKIDSNKEKEATKADVTPTPTSSPVMFEKNAEEEKKQTESNQSNMFLKPIQFAQPSISTTSQNSTFTPISRTPITSVASPILTVTSSTVPVVPTITFGKPTTAVTTAEISSPPKTGGFKFDLNKTTPIATTTASEPPKQSAIQFGQNSEQKSSVPTFTSPTLQFGKTTNFVPTTTASASSNSFSSPSSGGFKFGGNSTTTSQSPVLNKPLFSTPTTTLSPSFGNNTNPPPSFGLNVTSTPTFGNTTTSFGTVSKPTISFGTVTSSTSSFGTVTSSTPSFGTTVVPPTFGVATAVKTVPSFASSVTSSTPTFGINTSSTTATTAAATTPSFTFMNTFKSSAPTFGNITNTTSSFTTSSIASTTAPSFGIVSSTTTTAPPAFGTLKPTFSLPNTTVQTTSSTTTTTTSNIFAFGKSSNSFTFGQNKPNTFIYQCTPPTTSSTTSVFGGQSSFGQNQPPPPAFGATVTTTTTSGVTFNTAPVTSSFGSVFGGAVTTTTATTTTTPSVVFGSNTASRSIFTSKTTAPPTFGTSNNIFQAAQTNTNLFTTSAKPLFGTTSFTNGGTAPTFGNTNNNNSKGNASSGFGNTNSFATNTTTSSFTTPSSAFGGGTTTVTTTANVFGGTTNVTTTANVFGGTTNVTTTANVFGGTTNVTTTANVFGGTATTPSFGQTNTFGTTASTSNFGSPPQSNSSVFGGGQVSNFGQRAFHNSGGGGSLTNNNNQSFGFGSNATTATFTPTTTTNSSGGGGFGAPANSSGGIFTFGAGNNLPKPMYNFTGGAGTTNPPAFGAVTPQTGGTAAAVAPGMFSIGTGSPSTNRARSITKGRRRT